MAGMMDELFGRRVDLGGGLHADEPLAESAPTPSAYPGLTFPAYYDLNGKPAVIQSGGTLPQVLEHGSWVIYYDPPKFRMDAERITKEEFDALVKAQSGPR